MKAAVFGDIHGNAVALEAVLSDMKRLGADLAICHGDVVFRGPEPGRALSLLLEANCHGLVIGNTDEWLMRGFPLVSPRRRSGFPMLQTFREWALSQLGDDALERLSSFTFSHTFSLEGHRVTVRPCVPQVHGGLVDASSSDAELTPILEGVESDILVCGHIDTPYARRIGTRWVINVGSVGQPVDGDARASYLLLEADRGGLNVQFRRYLTTWRRRWMPREEATFLRERLCGSHPGGEELLRADHARRMLTRVLISWARPSSPFATKDLSEIV